MSTAVSVWTPEQEAELRRLLAMKERIMAEKFSAVEAEAILLAESNGGSGIFAQLMIDRADAITAALAPFLSLAASK